jgi:hypothetical protein
MIETQMWCQKLLNIFLKTNIRLSEFLQRITYFFYIFNNRTSVSPHRILQFFRRLPSIPFVHACVLGWVDFWRKFEFEWEYSWNTVYSFLCKITENSKKKFFGQVTFWGKVILWGIKHYITQWKQCKMICAYKRWQYCPIWRYFNTIAFHCKLVKGVVSYPLSKKAHFLQVRGPLNVRMASPLIR